MGIEETYKSIGELEFTNADEFNRKLAALRKQLIDFNELAKDGLQKSVTRLLLHLGGEMSVYPPPPSGSTYRRTGTLGRTWTAARPQFKASGTLFEGRIGNATPYANYVQKADDQAWMHKGRWQTETEVLDDNQAGIEKELERVGAKLVQDMADKVNAA